MFNKLMVLLVVSSLCIACSGTIKIKTPVSGKKFNVNIGCTQDKVEYDRVREEAKKPVDSEMKIVDCPDSGKEVRSY